MVWDREERKKLLVSNFLFVFLILSRSGFFYSYTIYYIKGEKSEMSVTIIQFLETVSQNKNVKLFNKIYQNTFKTDVWFKISSPAYVGFRLQSNPPQAAQWELAYLCQWWIRSWVSLRVSRNSPKLLSTRPRSVLLWLYFSRLPMLCLKRRFSSLSLSLSFCTLVVLSLSHFYKSSSHRTSKE